jgi:hypothetical protein
VRAAAAAALLPRLRPYHVSVRYTTVSQPECVDGWLGVQLSDKLWFPCWSSDVMTESAARMMPLIASLERTSAAQQPANPAASAPSSSISSVQAFPASPRSAATPPALLRNGSSANRAMSTPVADGAAPSDQAVVSLQERLEELQVANQALVARCAAMDSSGRGVDASAVSPASDARQLYGVIEALLSNQQAALERHERNLQTQQESLLASQQATLERSDSNLQTQQESLLASQQAALSSLQAALERSDRNLQTQLQQSVAASQALAVAACCVSAALLGIALLRARW